MNRQEIWAPCEEAGSLLEVSNLGRVRVIERVSRVFGRTRNGTTQGEYTQVRPAKMLSPYVARHGYLEIAVMIDGKRTKYRVHRLVARAFVAGFFEGASVDHLDGDKTNNRAENLEWVTLSENTRRQWESGLVDLRGDLAPGAKITNLQAHAVAVLYDNNFPPSQIADWFGIGASAVYKIANGKRVIGPLATRYARKSAKPREHI
jgi:hypothetical protein